MLLLSNVQLLSSFSRAFLHLISLSIDILVQCCRWCIQFFHVVFMKSQQRLVIAFILNVYTMVFDHNMLFGLIHFVSHWGWDHQFWYFSSLAHLARLKASFICLLCWFWYIFYILSHFIYRSVFFPPFFSCTYRRFES